MLSGIRVQRRLGPEDPWSNRQLQVPGAFDQLLAPVAAVSEEKRHVYAAAGVLPRLLTATLPGDFREFALVTVTKLLSRGSFESRPNIHDGRWIR